MKIYCTTCCKEKQQQPGEMPALDRYLDDRIKNIYNLAVKDGFPFRILSGEYGLLLPESSIPWYDKKLELNEVEILLPVVTTQLKQEKISEIYFYIKNPAEYPDWKPYRDVLKLGCEREGIDLIVKYI